MEHKKKHIGYRVEKRNIYIYIDSYRAPGKMAPDEVVWGGVGGGNAAFGRYPRAVALVVQTQNVRVEWVNIVVI